MGSLFRITLFAPDEVIARVAATNAFARVAELNRIMSDYDPESELMRLCRRPMGVPQRVSTELFDILERSQTLARQSDGAFDVTVGPLVQLWRNARRRKSLPSPQAIATARERVGYHHLKLNAPSRSVTLLAPEMKLDLGGIAKGYAADQALAVLRRYGITRAMCAASGDIAIGDPPPDKSGWRVGIGRMDARGDELEQTLLLHHAGISTSGDAEQFVEIDGVRYSHIVDPATGLGLTNRNQVTIIAPNATLTDGLATAVCVMGATRGLELIESLPKVSALIATLEPDGKRVIESRRFRAQTRAE
ncbi:MAG: FAD:protein FMN transferase [Verrucomicrobia bacterium]|nr:FAD:protein FMN transferase [Verrucomicrobiota bacterium]